MDFVNQIIESILANFDLAYMLVINIATYLIIKLIDKINGDKAVSTWGKRIVLVSTIIVISIAYIISGYEDYKILINSAIAAPVFYSWVLRPIFKKFKIGYKEFDETLK